MQSWHSWNLCGLFYGGCPACLPMIFHMSGNSAKAGIPNWGLIETAQRERPTMLNPILLKAWISENSVKNGFETFNSLMQCNVEMDICICSCVGLVSSIFGGFGGGRVKYGDGPSLPQFRHKAWATTHYCPHLGEIMFGWSRNHPWPELGCWILIFPNWI